MTQGPATTGFKTSNLHWALCSCRLHKCTHVPSITVQPVCWTRHRLCPLRDVDQFVWQFHNAAGLWRGSLSCSTLLIQHTCATDADRQRSPCARCCTAATLCGYPDKHSQWATNMSVRTCTVLCCCECRLPKPWMPLPQCWTQQQTKYQQQRARQRRVWTPSLTCQHT